MTAGRKSLEDKVRWRRRKGSVVSCLASWSFSYWPRLETRRAGGTEEGLLTSGIYFARFLTRVQPVYGPWSPYVEGVFGFQWFDTSVVLKDCVGSCEISEISSDTTVSAGGGGGLGFRLTGNGKGESGFSFEMGARYLFGAEAEFFLPSDLPALVRNLAPVPQRSRTNMVTISFGVVFDF